MDFFTLPLSDNHLPHIPYAAIPHVVICTNSYLISITVHRYMIHDLWAPDQQSPNRTLSGNSDYLLVARFRKFRQDHRQR